MRPITSTLIAPLILAACGGAVPSGEPDAALPGTPDASADASPDQPDAAAAPDAAPPRCDVTKPFGDATLVPVLNAPDEQGVPVGDTSAKLTHDERVVVFQSRRTNTDGGGQDLYIATRDDRDASFRDPVPVPGVNTASGEHIPVLSEDRMTLYFMRDTATQGDVFVATRATPTGAFSGVRKVEGLGVDADADGKTDDGPTHITAEGQLTFSSTKDGDRDLYTAARVDTHTFREVAPLAEINHPTLDDLSATLSSDGRIIYWASLRTDGGHEGDFDIWTATRSDPNARFGTPTRIAELSTAGRDLPTFVSDDGCVLYFDRGADLMFAVKPR